MDNCVCNAHSLLTTFAAPDALLRWFNPLNNAAIDARIAAGGQWSWRAQATTTTPYGPGPVDYAASRISNEGNAVVLGEGAGAVPWTALNGWTFVAAAVQYLITAGVPAANWGVFIQYDNAIVAGAGTLIGSFVAAPVARFFLRPNSGGNVVYAIGGNLGVAGVLVAGNIGAIGQTSYRNGVNDGAIPAGAFPAFVPFIGANSNSGAPIQHLDGNVQAAWIIDDVTGVTGADITAIAGLPDGSMHNL